VRTASILAEVMCLSPFLKITATVTLLPWLFYFMGMEAMDRSKIFILG
jgi:hypothetical protein